MPTPKKRNPKGLGRQALFMPGISTRKGERILETYLSLLAPSRKRRKETLLVLTSAVLIGHEQANRSDEHLGRYLKTRMGNQEMKTLDTQRMQHWKNWHQANQANPVDLATMLREKQAIERLDRIRPKLKAARESVRKILVSR